MDHYTVLGLRKDATKEEIKQAFRKLAMKFHPDKHSESPKTVKEGANHKFRQVSEAYEVLIDDRKRADYNLRHGAFNKYGGSGRSGYGYGYRHGGNAYGKSRYTYTPSSSSGYGDGFRTKFEIAVRFLTTRAFLLNVAFGSALLGGMVVIDFGRQSLWKTRNSGKSFEEAMESIEKAKSAKDV